MNYQVQADLLSVTFSSGLSGTFNFPVAYPNGLLSIQFTPLYSGTPAGLSVNLTGATLSQFSMGAAVGASAYSGNIDIMFIAIGC